jgi:hypothetical protein
MEGRLFVAEPPPPPTPPTAASSAAGVKDAAAPRPPPARRPATRQLAATAAAFLVSGLVHECIFFAVAGRTTGGRWMSFFLVQAPAIVAERVVQGALRRRGVPRPLRTAYTVSFVVGVAAPLFWAPAERAGVVAHLLGNVRGSYQAALRRAGLWARRAWCPAARAPAPRSALFFPVV